MVSAEIIDLKADNTIIVMDTNVWLGLYKIPIPALNIILASLNELENKIWVPNQVSTEFYRNVPQHKEEFLRKYSVISSDASEKLTAAKNSISQSLKNISFGSDEIESIKKEFEENVRNAIKKFKSDLTPINEKYKKEIAELQLPNLIEELFEGSYKKCSNVPLTRFELIRIFEEGNLRFKYNLGPGKTDKGKKIQQDKSISKENEWHGNKSKYGDLIIWKEILKKIEGNEVNLLFIEDEKKADWWESYTDRKIAVELVQEFHSVTKDNSKFIMMSFSDFLTTYNSQLELLEPIDTLMNNFRYITKIIECVEKNSTDIVLEKIDEDADDIFNVDLFEGVTVFGGSVNDIDLIEIEDFEINNIVIEQETPIDNHVVIVANVTVKCGSNISEYFKYNEYRKGQVNFEAALHVSLSIDINMEKELESDYENQFEDYYEISEFEVYDKEIISVSYSNFEIEYDDDYSNDYLEELHRDEI